MAKAARTDRLDVYRSCPQCDAPLEKLRIGGVGEWKSKIHCLKCQHVYAVPFSTVIVPLVYEQYPEISSRERVRALLEEAQRHYEARIAESDF